MQIVSNWDNLLGIKKNEDCLLSSEPLEIGY